MEKIDNLFDTNKRVYNPGHLIIRENEESSSFFVIQSGAVQVFRQVLGAKVSLAIIKEGEIFGEVSFLDGQPRSASIEAISEVVCLEISLKDPTQRPEIPSWAKTLIKIVVGRLRQTNHNLIQLKRHSNIRDKQVGLGGRRGRILAEITLGLERVFTLTKGAEAPSLNEIRSKASSDLNLSEISFYEFWRLLQLSDLVDQSLIAEKAVLKVRHDLLEAMLNFLHNELGSKAVNKLQARDLYAISKIYQLLHGLGLLNEETDQLEINLNELVTTQSQTNGTHISIESITSTLESLREWKIWKYDSGYKILNTSKTQIVTLNLLCTMLEKLEYGS